jgi:hypothetical protein
MGRLRSQSGVNYIQVLLVIVTAGIVGALVVPYFTNQEREEFWQSAFLAAETIAVAQEDYYAGHGEFTASRDSLIKVLGDSTLLMDPFTGREFEFGVANRGQDYSVSGGPSDRQILITTEDRWEHYAESWQKWVALQEQIRAQEAEARRRGRRGGA